MEEADMRVAFDELAPRDEARVRIHVASGELEARGVAAALDAAGLDYAEEQAPSGHGTVFYVGAGDERAAHRAVDGSTIRPLLEAGA
jgi:hypothetical protein